METSVVESLKSNIIFIAIVFSLFLILCIVNILNHEMWRDEMTVWMISDYNSLYGIFDTIKVQGHPALWYLVVKTVQQITPNPFGMALANLFFIALAVFVMLKYAPFNRLQAVLLSFSYFILYEYGTISRNYGMSIFFIFAVCALYARREKYTILIAILLAISCSVHSMNVIITSFIVILLAGEKIFSIKTPYDKKIPNPHLLIGTSIVIIGVLLALYQATPSQDSPWSESSQDGWRFHSPLSVLTVVWKSFVPISEPVINFWNTNIIPNGSVMIMLSILIVIISCLFFVRKPLICTCYVFGMLLCFFFFYKYYHGFTRHHGYLFIMFVVSYWISFNYRGVECENLLTRLNKGLLNKNFNFFTAICFIHFIAVFVPIYFDWHYPFSASQEVGQYLVKNNLQDNILFGDKDTSAAPVAGWIDRKMYYPSIGDYASYVIWNHPDRKVFPLKDIRNNKGYYEKIKKEAQEIAHNKNKDVILILNYCLDEKPLKTFTTSIVSDEIYYIYRVESGQQQT